MPTRPPQTAGIIWRNFRAGDRAGHAFAEWAYVSPLDPSGLPESDLPGLPAGEQARLALYWFQLNFEPEPNPGVYGAWSVGQPLAFGPTLQPPATILTEEFGGAIAPSLLAGLAAPLTAQAPLWRPIQNRPLLSFQPAYSAKHALEQARSALAAATAAIDELAALHGQAGHNQGPPLDDAEIEEVKSALSQAGLSLHGGAGGIDAVKASQTRLYQVFRWVGQRSSHLLDGALKAAGADIYVHRHSLIHYLAHALGAAINAIGSWLHFVINQ